MCEKHSQHCPVVEEEKEEEEEEDNSPDE